MVSLRFPFSFPQRPGHRSPHFFNLSSFPFSTAFVAASAAVLAGATTGIGVAIAISPNPSNAIGDPPYHNRPNSPAPLWASLSLAESSTTVVEPKTGVLFPCVVDGARRLLGIGLRKKNVFGLKNIDVYAFGVYAEVNDVKKLRENYGVLSESELRGSKEFFADVLEQDLRMTVKLQIVYGRLTIGSVRSAFEESVGNRLKKFSGSENKELLKRSYGYTTINCFKEQEENKIMWSLKSEWITRLMQIIMEERRSIYIFLGVMESKVQIANVQKDPCKGL